MRRVTAVQPTCGSTTWSTRRAGIDEGRALGRGRRTYFGVEGDLEAKGRSEEGSWGGEMRDVFL